MWKVGKWVGKLGWGNVPGFQRDSLVVKLVAERLMEGNNRSFRGRVVG